MLYIFEKRIVQGYQKWYFHESNMQIQRYKYTNTALVKVADRHGMCYILGNDTRTSKTMFYWWLSGKTNKECENLSQNNLLQKNVSINMKQCVMECHWTAFIKLKRSKLIQNRPERIKSVWIELKLSRQFWDRADSFETMRTVLKPSKQFWNC